jgi:hypothetical protein
MCCYLGFGTVQPCLINPYELFSIPHYYYPIAPLTTTSYVPVWVPRPVVRQTVVIETRVLSHWLLKRLLAEAIEPIGASAKWFGGTWPPKIAAPGPRGVLAYVQLAANN